eukprot:15204668-Alexandrium_andersonii.AAC.1
MLQSVLLREGRERVLRWRQRVAKDAGAHSWAKAKAPPLWVVRRADDTVAPGRAMGVQALYD